MHTLYQRKPVIQTLYVKSASSTWSIGRVFAHARSNSPCLLIMEDIETIVMKETRSYFFNEVDGLASNNGILMLASTNYLDKLDPGRLLFGFVHAGSLTAASRSNQETLTIRSQVPLSSP